MYLPSAGMGMPMALAARRQVTMLTPTINMAALNMDIARPDNLTGSEARSRRRSLGMNRRGERRAR